MNNKTKICDNCGALCNIYDTYCKKCSHSLLNSKETNEPIIQGIDNTELKNFLGKNSKYYLKKFAKAKNKNTFFQLNFASLLFGPTWFFYRKMHKLAILYAVILILSSSVLSVIFPAIFATDIDTYFDAKQTYSDYIKSGGEINIYKEGYSTVVIGTNPIFQEIRDNLDQAQNKIRLIDFLITTPVLIINILFRLLANSFYKKYIISNINSADGGTSGKAAFVGLILINIVMLIVSILLLKIPIVYRFQDAVQTLFNWI